MSDVAVKVENVSKDFRLPHEKATTIKSLFTSFLTAKKHRVIERQHALKNVSFEINKGEFFGIVGRNGSGKSTLLKMLAGIYQPNHGKVFVQGRVVPFIELGVGFNPELTGRENIYLNGALFNFSRAEIDKMYPEIVEFAELEKFMDQKLKNYSSGMQVRLSFSLAIRAKADILLVDEVLAVGDADFQRKCFDYFRSLKKSGTTVVFVSHNMDAVREYCDRAVLIETSEVIDKGPAQKIAAEYTRLFTEKDINLKTDKAKQKRWGNGLIQLKDPQAKLTNDQKKIIIETALTTNENAAKSPILGFLVKGPTGTSILGSNTKLIQKELPDIKSGHEIICKFEFDNIFNDGVHTVDLAVIDNDGITVCDWWENAVTFRINKEQSSPYIVNPEVSLTVS